MDVPDSLPDVRDEDNPIVWCERCQKHHRHYTFTREDFERIVDGHVDALAARIDAEALRTLILKK